MKINVSVDAALIMTITTTFLYMVGQIYLGAYFTAFGADVTILNFSIQDKVYRGYLRAIEDVHYIILFFTIFFATPFLLKKIGLTPLLSKILKKIKSKIYTKKHAPPIHNTTTQITTAQNLQSQFRLLYITFIMFFGSLSYLTYIALDTQSQALNDILNYKERFDKVKIRNNTDRQTYGIICGSSLCAILFVDENPLHLRFIDPKNVYFIIHEQKNQKDVL